MKKLFQNLLLLFCLISISGNALAQQGSKDFNPILTTMPSMSISPDARAGGMGDAGVATAPDVYSQHWNASKYAFATSSSGFALSYTPWLRKLVDDIALMQAVGFFKLGSNDDQAISGSIRYFKIGDINIFDMHGENINSISPNEMSIDLGYSRKLSQTFSMAVALRWLHSDYSGASDEISAGNTVAADISGYNESYIFLGNSESLLSFGVNLSNLGGKMSIDDNATKQFIPANMRIGASLMYPMNDVSTLSFSADMNKLLVPTPPIMGESESREEYMKRVEEYNNTSSISGIFKSFGTADGGFSEKMKELVWSFGAEYDYDGKFRVRSGYYHENKMKGNRRYMTFGAGFKLSAFQLDAAYLLSTAGQANPLDQTLRFSLAFDTDGIKRMVNR